MKRVYRAFAKKIKLLALPAITTTLVGVLPLQAKANNTDIIVEHSSRQSVLAYSSSGFLEAYTQANSRKKADNYIRLSFSGTALMTPGASKTIKKSEPEPVESTNVQEPYTQETVQVAVAYTPTTQVATQPAPAPTPAPAPESDNPKALPDQGSAIRWGGKYKAGIHFPYGQCTYFAAQYRGGVDFLGNAREWYANAQAAGYNVGSTPRVHAIIVTTESGYGHVGIVTAVHIDGSFSIKEMNYIPGQIGTRTLPANFGALIGFIY